MPVSDADVQNYIKSYQPPPPEGAAQPLVHPVQQSMQPPPGKTTPSFLDNAVTAADTLQTPFGVHIRNARDLASGALKGLASTGDAVKSAVGSMSRGLSASEDPDHAPEALDPNTPDPFTPMYEHARGLVMGVRDAIAVKDPDMLDNLTEGVGQFAPSYMMFARVMGSIGGLAKLGQGGNALEQFGGNVARFAAADTPTMATAQGPHDGRMADTFQLLRHSEGKLGDIMRSVAPDGSLMDHYINYLSGPVKQDADGNMSIDHANESEASGRFKNVLDSYGISAALSTMIHGAAGTFKQGWSALHYMADNGMGSMSDLLPANQVGAIGYHGTPNAPFDEFENSKIDSGQGAQSYGYGHYIAQDPATAGSYQRSLSNKMNTSEALKGAQYALAITSGDKGKAYSHLMAAAANETDPQLRARMENSARVVKYGNADQGSGSLMTVDIDDKHIAGMIDHDKLMKDQPNVLKKIPAADQEKLSEYLENAGRGETNGDLGELTGGQFRRLIEKAHEDDIMLPTDFAETHMPRAASQYLSAQGIPGIKYWDQGSRVLTDSKSGASMAGPNGTRNYVVFDGKHIKVSSKGK